MKKLVFLALLGLSTAASASEPNFEVFCKQLLQKQPALSDYSAYFTKDFQNSILLEDLKALFAGISEGTGSCVSYKYTSTPAESYILTLSGDKKLDVILILGFDQKQGLFNSLLVKDIHDPSVQIQRWSDLVKILSRLDPQGKLSATLTTADGSLKLNHNSTEALAIGSTFKLYILGALEKAIVKGPHRWNEILPITEEWKSLPSGVMHTWPAGQPVSLYDYAEKMISLSDNTATDHLLNLLGRENVESMLAPMGNSHQAAYLPLLSTLEFFKLKWAIPPKESQNYIQKDAKARLAVLEKLKLVPASQVGTNGVDLYQPTLNDKLEWFATTPENCQAMFWLASRNSPQIRSILSKNVPAIDIKSPESHWSYVGYKGGSEPGVFSMTFLLESKKGTRACLSMTWNNATENVSQFRFMDLMKKTLKFAETQVP